MQLEYSKIILQEGQTLADAAIEAYGCYEGIFLIMEDNQLSLDSTLAGGDTLKIRKVIPELNLDNQETSKQYKLSDTTVNSSLIFSQDTYTESEYVEDNYVTP